jgi:LacI family transcriptional regulator
MNDKSEAVKMKKNVTIYNIAEESGVSVSTVSRVINNSPHVSARTLKRVQEVIDKYQFSPSALARAMSINQTHTIGVVTPDIANPYFSALFLEIERHALQNSYSIVLCNTLFGGSSRGVSSSITEAQYFTLFAGKEVDGVIVTGGEIDKEEVSAEYIAAINRLATIVPVVIIGQEVQDCEGCLFLNRNLGGGFPSLVRHLSALGNRRIAFVGGEPGVRQTTARLAAYQATLESLNLPCDPALIALSNYYTKDGYSAMSRILDDPAAEKPDAVVAINDAVAIGAIRTINDHGLRCPEDIALVSGDQFFESDYITPRLTSLDQQNNYLGRLSIMTLISAINGVREAVEFEHNPRLIIRESCGAQIDRVF